MDRLIERKQMSTKTTFKRVALVAVAALGFGMLSVVPSNAAFTAGNIDVSLDSLGTYTVTQITGAGIAGPANFVQITQTGSADAYHLVATGGTLFSNSATAASVTGSGTSSVVVATGITAVLNVPTPTVGTIVIKNYPITLGVESSTATSTVTITVAAAATGTVYAASAVAETATAAAGAVYKYTNAATTVVTRLADYAQASSVELYSFTVTQNDATPSPLGTASTKAVTASLSGVGSLSMNGTSAVSQYVALAAASANNAVVHVYADGRAGKSTLTIAVNGVTVKTYDFIFWGAVASYDLAIDQTTIAAAGAAGSASVTALDANGQAVPGKNIYLTSATTATATVGAPANVTGACILVACTPGEWDTFGYTNPAVTGLVAGTSVITAQNATTAATSTVSKTATVTVVGNAAASVTWALDKSDYLPGEKGTLTITLKDSAGALAGDDIYTVWSTAPTASSNVTWITTPGATVTTVSGVASYSFYVPVTSGTVTISGTIAANSRIGLALQGAKPSLSATVSNADTQAATDAAAEATDAANAATDAANAAAEAADAATAAAQDAADAVAALSAQVATLIGALKAQLTALTNLVIKIQKKVKA